MFNHVEHQNVCMHYPFCLKKDHLGSNGAMWWTHMYQFSHQHHHRRAFNECSVYIKKETPHKLRSFLTKQYLSVLRTRASRKPESGMWVWDYVLSRFVWLNLRAMVFHTDRARSEISLELYWVLRHTVYWCCPLVLRACCPPASCLVWVCLLPCSVV